MLQYDIMINARGFVKEVKDDEFYQVLPVEEKVQKNSFNRDAGNLVIYASNSDLSGAFNNGKEIAGIFFETAKNVEAANVAQVAIPTSIKFMSNQ